MHLLDRIVAPLAALILAVISTLGYGGIVLCMAIESACVPLPSEIIMPFSGYLVTTGRFMLWGVVLAGASGNVLGSWLSYWLGSRGGRPLAQRLARWRVIRMEEYDRADGWLKRHGLQVAFWTRLLPIVRTFISFPAGAARVPFWRFSLYTFLGSAIWSLVLATIGVMFREHWDRIREYWHGFDLAVVAALGLLFLLWLRSHFRSSHDPAPPNPSGPRR
ncbi:MAG TPA: DedA family protein [Candidatus Dormibacteraeota bacterium]|nr:DedA family protein [Candidatus Dormibacteraeota bacterium]